MKNHEFLNHLIELHWLGRLDVKYLEIGVRDHYTFRRVNSTCRYGVDPNHVTTFYKTSDEFFKLNKQERGLKFELVLIDGLHQREQVVRDVLNSLECLNFGGIIVLDDCRPREEYQQLRAEHPPDGRPWNGDVWKAVVDLRQDQTIDVCVVDEGWGFGVVLPRPNTDILSDVSKPLTWEGYRQYGPEWLRPVSLTELQGFLEGYSNGQN